MQQVRSSLSKDWLSDSVSYLKQIWSKVLHLEGRAVKEGSRTMFNTGTCRRVSQTEGANRGKSGDWMQHQQTQRRLLGPRGAPRRAPSTEMTWAEVVWAGPVWVPSASILGGAQQVSITLLLRPRGGANKRIQLSRRRQGACAWLWNTCSQGPWCRNHRQREKGKLRKTVGKGKDRGDKDKWEFRKGAVLGCVSSSVERGPWDEESGRLRHWVGKVCSTH